MKVQNSPKLSKKRPWGFNQKTMAFYVNHHGDLIAPSWWNEI